MLPNEPPECGPFICKTTAVNFQNLGSKLSGPSQLALALFYAVFFFPTASIWIWNNINMSCILILYSTEIKEPMAKFYLEKFL